MWVCPMFSHDRNEVIHFLTRTPQSQPPDIAGLMWTGRIIRGADLDQWSWPLCQASPMRKYILPCVVNLGFENVAF